MHNTGFSSALPQLSPEPSQKGPNSHRDRLSELSPDLSPKYLVTVGTRWYLLGLAAAPLYQRVPTSPNSHKHYRDSNSLGGTRTHQRPAYAGLCASRGMNPV